MGHLLGAASPGPSTGVMSNPPVVVTQVEVNTLRLPDRLPPGIASFAIDSPRAHDRFVGAGIEINGWVIGLDAPVQGVRTVNGEQASRVYPLDVPRPDVADAYPVFGHASASGFTAWVSLAARGSAFEIDVEAVLATGDAVTLAAISGTVCTARRCGSEPDALPVTAPDFVIIGTQRGGTTSLHAYLSAHPQVKAPAKKELHFLTDRFERGLDWYLDQFPVLLPSGAITGEATPYALFHPLAPERLRQIAPHAKLIVLLRNPVDRAYSHYLLERSRGFEPLDFAAALDAEADRLTGEEVRIMRDPAYVSEAHKHASYLARGDYAPQLERWLAHVPREQLLVLRSEDLYERPAETTAQVAAFLGIAPAVDIPFAAHNRSAGPPLEPALRTRLRAHFAPKIARLGQLLDWNPDWA
jgi:hypothetical protein